jgi:hypothetical protein
MNAIQNQYTPEYTLADLRRVTELCVDAMKRHRRDFDSSALDSAVAALESSRSQPAADAARTVLASLQRIEAALEFAAESTACRLDTVYASLALDACLCAKAAMKHGGW